MLRRSFFLLPLVVGACAATPTQAPPAPATPASQPGPQRFKGVWDFHFETSSFTSEDGQGPYWVSGEGDVWHALTAPFGATGRPWGQAAIEVEGALSAPGHYGHLGAYARELRVTRVLSSTLVRRE